MQQNTQPNFAQWYADERDHLSQEEVYSILDQGIELASQTHLVDTLSNGGAALFPHCSIRACGDQVSAVVNSCLQAYLNTNKHQILIIGVMHPLTDMLKQAYRMAREGYIVDNPCRGIFGPGLPKEELLSMEFSLDNFIFLLKHAAKRKGMTMPKIISRYPALIYGQQDNMLGLEELKHLAQESIVIATSDLFHYGTAYSYYGVLTSNPDEKIPISQTGYDLAMETIKENLHLLSQSNWPEYIQYCANTNSDGCNVGQLLHFLLGSLEGNICDLRLVDVSYFFKEKAQPNWVATALIEFRPKSHCDK